MAFTLTCNKCKKTWVGIDKIAWAKLKGELIQTDYYDYEVGKIIWMTHSSCLNSEKTIIEPLKLKGHHIVKSLII